MDNNVLVENEKEFKVVFFSVIKDFFSSSENKEGEMIDEEVESIRREEEPNYIKNLEIATTPKVKSAKFGTRNIKEKVQNRKDRTQNIKHQTSEVIEISEEER